MKIDESKARLKIARIKKFYTQAMIYAMVFLLCVLIWFFVGSNHFWPIWPLLAFIFALSLEAIKVGQFPFLTKYFEFLTPEWEEKEVQKLLEQPNIEKNNKQKD